MEKKWIFISVLMHAVLLLGVGATFRPVQNRAPAIIEVHLVSSSVVDRIGDGKFALTSEQPDRASTVSGKSDPVPGKKEDLFFPAAVEIETGLERRSNTEQIASFELSSHAGLPSDQEQPIEMEKISESVPEDDDIALLAEPETEPGKKINSGRLTEDEVKGDSTGNQSIRVSPVYTHGLASQLQASSFKHHTSLLAFAGNPSSLGGILATATGTEAGTWVGTGAARPEVVYMPEPVYPVLSRRLGEEGRVVLKIKISEGGEVLSAKVAGSSSYERLDHSALRAIENATFRPAERNGRPVTSERTVAYVFRLEE